MAAAGCRLVAGISQYAVKVGGSQWVLGAGPTALGLTAIGACSFAGAGLVSILVLGLAARRRFTTSTLFLAGIAVSLTCSALILFVQYRADFTAGVHQECTNETRCLPRLDQSALVQPARPRVEPEAPRVATPSPWPLPGSRSWH